MPYYIGRVVDDARRLVIRSPEAFREKQGIDARVFQRIMEIDLPQRQVQAEEVNTGKTWREPFDQLLVATGALPLRPPIPGLDARGVYGLNTLQSGIEVRRAVDEKNPRQIVIIGGGYIGLEMAENFTQRGLGQRARCKSGEPVGAITRNA